jgi:hypothetical protein
MSLEIIGAFLVLVCLFVAIIFNVERQAPRVSKNTKGKNNRKRAQTIRNAWYGADGVSTGDGGGDGGGGDGGC